jgi:hypothetical protein
LYEAAAMSRCLALLAFLSACSLTPTRHRKSALVADVAAVASAALIANAALCTPPPRTGSDQTHDEACTPHLFAAAGLGVPLALVAAGFGIHALTGIERRRDVPGPATCEVAAITPLDDTRLPARDTGGDVVRRAHAARRAALAGDRARLGTLMAEIADRDRGYHAELSRVPVIDRCLSDS